MVICSSCKTQPPQGTRLSKGLCRTCINAQSSSSRSASNSFEADEEGNSLEIDDETVMSSVSFGMFKTWICSQIRSIIKEELTKVNEHFVKLDKEVKTLQNEMKTAKTNITTLQTDVKTLKNDVNNLTRKFDDNKSVSENNLKYLINHDRNVRKSNILLFGVPEDEPLELDGVEGNPNTDSEKCISLFQLIGSPQSQEKMVDCFRIGPIVEDKVRPIKVKFVTPAPVTSILKNAKKLSESSNRKIYIKSDKSKAENSEFQRLGKRKTELLEQYPSDNDNDPRVTLVKGVLKLDGAEVDRYKPVQSLF